MKYRNKKRRKYEIAQKRKNRQASKYLSQVHPDGNFGMMSPSRRRHSGLVAWIGSPPETL